MLRCTTTSLYSIGKSYLAEAIAHEFRGPLQSLKGSDLKDKYIGESEKKMHEAFEKAAREAPSVLFFDEIHLLLPKSAHQEGNNQGFVAQFLMELNQCPKDVLIMGATNEPDQLDCTITRRFKHHLRLTYPNQKERVQLIQYLTAKTGLLTFFSSQELALLAEKVSGYSINDIEAVVEKASAYAIDRLTIAKYFCAMKKGTATLYIPCQKEDVGARTKIKCTGGQFTSVISMRFMEKALTSVSKTAPRSKSSK